MRSGRAIWALAAVGVQTLFAWTVLAGLDAPLLWFDEADTAMFGRRILEYGYPKVHGPRNIVYGVHHPLEIGSDEALDAYLGSPWGQYYFAAPAVAWSDGARDLGERTRRVRLPFALAGWAGVLLLGAVMARGWPAAAGGRAVFWLGYGVCLLLSVSLQLHLREARYYPLVVLALGAIAWLELGRGASGARDPWRHALLLGAALFALFNLFYPAFGAVMGAAGIALGWRALVGSEPPRARARAFARDAAPYALAGLAVLPMAAFYGIPAQSRSFFAVFAGPETTFARQALEALRYLLRFELLAPVVVAVVATGFARRRAGTRDPALRGVLSRCDLAALLVAVWIALVARTPLFFERYLIALSPVLGGLLVLHLGTLVALRATPARRIAQAGAVAVALCFAASALVRAPELAGRWHELREPYQGPLDHVIPYLAERYEDPSQLVIATNYEESAYMFYLGATTTFGFYAPDRERDSGLAPDVIVPRPWPRNLSTLAALAGQDGYHPHAFPVANVRADNVPGLSARNPAGIAHRFRSPVVGPDGEALVIGERRAP